MKILRLSGCILVSASAGVIGSVFTARSVTTWYADLAKPAFTPPGWLFGPVWTVLYIVMGVALYLVWQKSSGGGRDVVPAVVLFFTQLLLNAAWSVIFFGEREIFIALVEISVLWVLVLLTVISFWRVTPVAGVLLLPYLLWVGFAAVLNHSIWQLNRGAL